MPLKRLFHSGRGYCPWKKLCRVIFPVVMLAIAVFIAFFTILHLSKYVTAKSKQTEIQAERWEKNSLTEPPESLCHSYCPVDEAMKSSKVTRLGNYPQAKRFLSIGIASVARPSGTNYLLQTIQSLINNTSDMDKKNTYIVIFLADLHEPPKSTAKEEIKRSFGKYIDQGLLIVIEAYPEYYPPLTNIKNKYGDSDKRRTWRSKENVDSAFVMCFCKNLSQYYIHLEDDMISSRRFFPKLQDFIKRRSEESWPILDASMHASKAKVFHSADLENMASYLYLLYDEMPIDWLMIQWQEIKDQKPFNRGFRLPSASLFQHIGNISSLKENDVPQQGSDKESFFDQYDQKYSGLNPPASVTSSLSSHQGKPQDAYEKGSGYFWSKGPRKDDYVLIKFNTLTAVQEVFVDTGSYNAWGDIIKSGVLQACFDNTNPCREFKTVGSFNGGKAKISLDESKKVICLRILVTQDQSEWIYFREIDVWYDSQSTMHGAI